MYSKMLNERNLLKEKHSGGLAGHFGHDKTYAQLSSSYHWPGMRSDVKKFVDNVESSSMQKGNNKTLVVSAISYSRQVMGCHKHGFCVGITKNPEGE
jgi:hypothetical protein